MDESASELKSRLKQFGFADPAIEAAWPDWWSDEADSSMSAQAQLRFSLARKFGLDPNSLLQANEQPRFIWYDVARFKHLAGESEIERAALTSFGVALAKILLNATPASRTFVGTPALALRRAVIDGGRKFVDILDLLSICWSFGIPTVHPTIFPMHRKRMAAMTVASGSRNVVVVGKNASYPAPIAFYIAHELGHIALGHLKTEDILIDLDRSENDGDVEDSEEVQADRYALELLTGESSPRVLSMTGSASARALADAALRASPDLAVEPGTLAMCFGYSNGAWPLVNASMHHIYESRKDVSREINEIAIQQMSLELLSDDMLSYLWTLLRGETQE